MNGLQIKLQLDDNQPAHWFDVETINFDDEVCFADGVGEHIEIEYQGEPLRIKPPSLTDDQQVVLESLKHYYSKPNFYAFRKGKEPMQAVGRMLMEAESVTTGLSDVYYRLTEKQQFQVLAAFAEWGIKREEEN